MNPTECVVMRLADRASWVLEDVGEELWLVNLHTDFSLSVDSWFKFHIHVGVIVNEASALINQLLRSIVCSFIGL